MSFLALKLFTHSETHRLEAIALRLEVVASRLEAIDETPQASHGCEAKPVVLGMLLLDGHKKPSIGSFHHAGACAPSWKEGNRPVYPLIWDLPIRALL